MKKLLLITYLCLLFVISKGQTITPDDFKLCLDNYGCSDSTLKLTKKQLLGAKVLTPNFSWFTITELTFYFSPQFGTDVMVQNCKGNIFCTGLRPIFERCGPGATVTISAKGHNKSSVLINWGEITIKITDL